MVTMAGARRLECGSDCVEEAERFEEDDTNPAGKGDFEASIAIAWGNGSVVHGETCVYGVFDVRRYVSARALGDLPNRMHHGLYRDGRCWEWAFAVGGAWL